MTEKWSQQATKCRKMNQCLRHGHAGKIAEGVCGWWGDFINTMMFMKSLLKQDLSHNKENLC